MVRRLYKHRGAVGRASEMVWDEVVAKFGKFVKSTSPSWESLNAKRQRRIEKIMRRILKVSERVGRTRPPR